MNKKNNINKVDELKRLLIKILKTNGRLKKLLVKEFEDKLNLYYEKNKSFPEKDVDVIFNELLVDLAYYQPNPIIRLTDKKHLFGDKELNKRIKEALNELNIIKM